jgi:WXXGXW repeat (2 copies)
MRARTFAILLPLLSSACFVRGGAGLFFLLADTAIVTAIIVSATAPPPPRIVYIPEPRPGYAYQPGYWTLHDGDWLWVDGGWLVLQPG